MKPFLLLKNYFFILLFLPFIAFSQQRDIDSLKNVLKTQKEDTNKVNTLNKLSWNLILSSQYDSAFAYAESAKKIAKKFSFNFGVAAADGLEGGVFFSEGLYTKAIEYYQNALAIDDTLKREASSATVLGNIGNVYSDQGDYVKAVQYDLKALAIYNKLKNKKGIARNLSNIGVVYQHQQNYTKASECYFKALSMYHDMGNKIDMANTLANIGDLYDDQKNDEEALKYNFKALAIFKTIGDKNDYALTLGDIGGIYFNQKKYSKALNYFFEALPIEQKIKDYDGAMNIICNIGNTYRLQKKYRLAKIYLDSALVNSKKMESKALTRDAYQNLSILDSTIGNHKTALTDYKNYIIYRDSLVNSANTKKIVQAQITFDFQQKEAAQQAIQEQKNIVEKQERNKQRIIRNAFIGGFLLMFALAFFIFRGLREKQKANVIISEQKQKVDLAFAQLHQKHTEITDSINYAKRIQLAMLKEENHVSKNLPEHFIFFQPKDVVSGDFYWSFEKENFWYVAAVDCTGHGVPGAFLTMLGSAFLNDICAQKNNFSPAEILNLLRDKIIHELGGQSEVKDGMDISLCRINLLTKEIEWSGANNPLWIIQQNEFQEFKPDKQPIGFQQNQKPFTNHIVQLKEGSLIYLFTDGIADQFGGVKGKKFKYKQLKEIFQTISMQSMSEQKQIVQTAFQNWKGNLEQVDDVCVIGIRV